MPQLYETVHRKIRNRLLTNHSCLLIWYFCLRQFATFSCSNQNSYGSLTESRTVGDGERVRRMIDFDGWLNHTLMAIVLSVVFDHDHDLCTLYFRPIFFSKTKCELFGFCGEITVGRCQELMPQLYETVHRKIRNRLLTNHSCLLIWYFCLRQFATFSCSNQNSYGSLTESRTVGDGERVRRMIDFDGWLNHTLMAIVLSVVFDHDHDLCTLYFRPIFFSKTKCELFGFCGEITVGRCQEQIKHARVFAR